MDANKKDINDDYKTELCHLLQEMGECLDGDKCRFAHDFKELRLVEHDPEHKSSSCRNFHKLGFCPYGGNCHFLHGYTEESAKHQRQEEIREKQEEKEFIKKCNQELLYSNYIIPTGKEGIHPLNPMLQTILQPICNDFSSPYLRPRRGGSDGDYAQLFLNEDPIFTNGVSEYLKPTGKQGIDNREVALQLQAHYNFYDYIKNSAQPGEEFTPNFVDPNGGESFFMPPGVKKLDLDNAQWHVNSPLNREYNWNQVGPTIEEKDLTNFTPNMEPDQHSNISDYKSDYISPNAAEILRMGPTAPFLENNNGLGTVPVDTPPEGWPFINDYLAANALSVPMQSFSYDYMSDWLYPNVMSQQISDGVARNNYGNDDFDLSFMQEFKEQTGYTFGNFSSGSESVPDEEKKVPNINTTVLSQQNVFTNNFLSDYSYAANALDKNAALYSFATIPTPQALEQQSFLQNSQMISPMVQSNMSLNNNGFPGPFSPYTPFYFNFNDTNPCVQNNNFSNSSLSDLVHSLNQTSYTPHLETQTNSTLDTVPIDTSMYMTAPSVPNPTESIFGLNDLDLDAGDYIKPRLPVFSSLSPITAINNGMCNF